MGFTIFLFVFWHFLLHDSRSNKCKRGTFLGAMFRGFTYPFENGNKQTRGLRLKTHWWKMKHLDLPRSYLHFFWPQKTQLLVQVKIMLAILVPKSVFTKSFGKKNICRKKHQFPGVSGPVSSLLQSPCWSLSGSCLDNQHSSCEIQPTGVTTYIFFVVE